MKIGLFSIKDNAKNQAAVGKLKKYFQEQDFRYEVNPKKLNNPDLAISVGGDGALIDLLRKIYREKNSSFVPAIGYNTGSFGFLSLLNAENYVKVLDEVIRRKRAPGKITGLSVERFTRGELFAVQDVVIRNGDVARTIEFSLKIAGAMLSDIVSDGLIISNYIGSSGYALACGNPFIYPGSDVFIVSLLNPHSITTRNLVVPASVEINIELKGDNQNIIMTLDGKINEKLRPGDKILISAGEKINLYTGSPAEFTKKLTAYFHYGKRK